MSKYLKLFFVALFATLTLGLTSCGDDDDDEGAGSNVLVGTWVGSLDEEYGDENNSEVVTMTFKSNGKMTAKGTDAAYPDDDWSFSGTYKVESRGAANRYYISLVGYFDGDDEFYDDDEDYRAFTIQGDELWIFFDGSTYHLYRQ